MDRRSPKHRQRPASFVRGLTLWAGISLLVPWPADADAQDLPAGAQPARPETPAATQAVPRPTAAPVYAGPEARRGADDARAGLRRPPPPTAIKGCRPGDPAEALSRDWTNPTDEAEIDPAAVLADAMALAQGNTKVMRDKPLARSLLERAAARNAPPPPRAKRELALLLMDPEAGDTDPVRARALLEAALSEREPTAALSLGRLVRDGRLPAASPDEAARYFSMAASFGEPGAGLEFAALFTRGTVPEPFAGAGEQYLTLALIGAQTAIQQGNCLIAAGVGDLLLGSPEHPDIAAALPWYEFGDKIDDPVSELRLAALHAAGNGMPMDRDKALALEEAAAAHGSIDGMTRAAQRHLEEGRSLTKGLALAEKAAEHHSLAALRLIARYHRGDFSAQADFGAMNAVLDRALALPGAGTLLLADKADALSKGYGAPADPAGAAALYGRIAAIATPEADFKYATFLLRTGADAAERDRRLLRAAEAGYPLAMLEVSDTLRCEGRPDQAADAETWRRRAADAGSAAAMRRIALVEADLGHREKAKAGLERAANLGERLSMVELVKMTDTDAERTTWTTRATADGSDVVEGRLGLARAMLSGEIAGGDAAGGTLLASLKSSGNEGADFEIAKISLSAARADEAPWKEAMERLVRSARAGNAKAMTLLARLGGLPGEAGAPSARDWLMAAAEAGDPQALASIKTAPEAVDVLQALGRQRICEPAALIQMARLSREFGDGSAVPRFLERAGRLAQERARDLAIVGEAYASGVASGRPDAAMAEPFLAEAVRRGSQRAAVSLARLMAGDGSRDRYAEALNLLRGAAVAGEPMAVKTITALADEHAGRSDDFDRTLALLRDLSEGGNAEAMFAIGSILGNYDDMRRVDGIAYLERAAAERHVGAMKALAQLYAAGLSDGAAAGKSTRWTRAAAELGDPEAMFRYALALDIGFGVPQDHAAANTWHERARDHGYLN